MNNNVLVGGPINLTYDTDEVHQKARRETQCPSNWKRNHPCPETNQPPAIPAGQVLGLPGTIVDPRRLDPFLPIDKPGAYVVRVLP